MKKEYEKPSLEIVELGEKVFTDIIGVSGGELQPEENQDSW